MGAAAGASDSTLKFNDSNVGIRQYAVSATAGHVWASRLSVRVSVGAVLDGALDIGARSFDISTGIVGSVGVARQWIFGDAWFFNGTAGFSASRATTVENQMTERVSIVATDLRFGAMAGRRFGTVSPYVLARVFAGPVSWSVDGTDIKGADTHKFQLGAGASLALPSGLALIVDVAALGERSASLGMSFAL